MRRIAALFLAPFLAPFLAFASLATPALAQISVGATIKDTSGGIVGKVDSVSGGNVLVDTGDNKVAIPETSFGTTPDGPLLAMTKAQLDAAAEQAMAAAKAQLAAAIQLGAEVRGTAGAVIGTIDKLEGELVRLAGAAGKARIPVSGLVLKADGLHFGMTAEQFAQAVAASKAAGESEDDTGA